jgi:hypothetical protein
VNVLGVLEHLGVETDRFAGDEVWALCPMHLERTGKKDGKASWSINQETGEHHCFSCGYSGGLRGLISDTADVESGKVGRWMAQHGVSDLEVKDWEDIQRRDRARRKEEAPVTEAHLFMFEDPPAWALRSRRLSRDEASAHEIGWQDKTESWMIPIRARKGALLGYQLKAEEKGGDVRNRPPTMVKSTTLFGIRQFEPGNVAVLLESPLDVVRLATVSAEQSMRYSVLSHVQGLAAFGSNVSTEQMDLLMSVTEHVILALDWDASGRPAMDKLVNAYKRRLRVTVLNYGEVRGKDIGERKVTDADIERGVASAWSPRRLSLR